MKASVCVNIAYDLEARSKEAAMEEIERMNGEFQEVIGKAGHALAYVEVLDHDFYDDDEKV